MKNICLTGFMGCGKSSVGMQLATEIGFEFLDSDKIIEMNTSKKIADIINDWHEVVFRDMETETIRNLIKLNNVVMSVGGGAIIRDENFKLLSGNSVIFFVDTDFEKCYDRIKADKNRPLSFGKEKQDVLALYNSRIATYKENCDFCIDGNDNVKNIIENIKKLMSNC